MAANQFGEASMKLRHSIAIFFLWIVMPSSIIFGENIDKDLKKQLEQEIKNKPLMIRNFYSGNDLEYDSDGKIKNGGSPGIWTVSGYFQPEKIKLSKKNIVIEGKRLYWTYDHSGRTTKLFRCPEKTTISIARIPEYNSHPLIMILLHKVFFASDESFEDSVPAYWKELVQRKFILKDSANIGMFAIINGNVSVQKALENPRVLYRVNPHYTEEARKARLSGGVTLNAIINEEGNATVQEIIHPLGAGLDESAIKACETWKFAPALLNGSPVKMEVVIEVDFGIH
jgi:TonB family protein